MIIMVTIDSDDDHDDHDNDNNDNNIIINIWQRCVRRERVLIWQRYRVTF